MPAEIILFIHIPKAAGNSLNAMFRNSGYQQIDLVNGTFGAPPPKPHFYTGHYALSHDIFQQCRDMHYAVFSIIRDPIDRMISNYNFTLRRPGAPWHQDVVDGALDPAGLARNFIDAIGHQYSHFARSPTDGVDTCYYNLLTCLHAFGLSERMDEARERFSRILGVDLPSTAPKNVTSDIQDNGTRLISRDDLTAAQMRELAELLAPDIYFYERARDEYERRAIEPTAAKDWLF